MKDQDDKDWFEILAGREVKNADPHTRQEAEALRKAILQQHQDELENDQTNSDELGKARGLKQLLEHLEEKGLLEDPKPQKQTKSSRMPIYSAVAAATVIFLSVFTLIPTTQEPLLSQTSSGFKEFRLRSGMETQTIPVKNQRDSHKTAKKLIQQLTELKIPYRFTPLDKKEKADWQFEIMIPFKKPKNILTFLEQWRLKETENGWIMLMPEKP